MPAATKSIEDLRAEMHEAKTHFERAKALWKNRQLSYDACRAMGDVYAEAVMAWQKAAFPGKRLRKLSGTVLIR